MALALTAELARHLESGAAEALPRLLAALRSVAPDQPSDLLARDDVAALYGGPTSPLNDAIGLGLFGPATPEALDAVEAFFEAHSHPSVVSVISLAHPTALELTAARGYRLTDFGHRWVLDLQAWHSPLAAPDERVRPAHAPGEELTWARAVEGGFADADDLGPEVDLTAARTFFRLEGAMPVIALQDGQAAAGGMLDLVGNVACLFAAATRPTYRRRGLQAALLDWRLRAAQERGKALATIETDPGSASQRNVERMGFQLAYAIATLERP